MKQSRKSRKGRKSKQSRKSKKNRRFVKYGGGIKKLQNAIDQNNLELLRRLLETGEDSTILGNNGNTLLMRVALKSSGNLAQLLLEKGADPNIQNTNNLTALIIACLNENT